jgi:hypothetical protein
MGKRLEITSMQQLRSYAGSRFRHDEPFSRLNEEEKAYCNIYNMQADYASLSQFKSALEEHNKLMSIGHTRRKIYQFFIDRIVQKEILR